MRMRSLLCRRLAMHSHLVRRWGSKASLGLYCYTLYRPALFMSESCIIYMSCSHVTSSVNNRPFALKSFWHGPRRITVLSCSTSHMIDYPIICRSVRIPITTTTATATTISTTTTVSGYREPPDVRAFPTFRGMSGGFPTRCALSFCHLTTAIFQHTHLLQLSSLRTVDRHVICHPLWVSILVTRTGGSIQYCIAIV